MRYLIILSTFAFVASSLTMQKSSVLQPESRLILGLAYARIQQHLNLELLEIARQSDKNQLFEDIKTYYSQQPKNQISFWAYLKKPVINIRKSFAFLQLMRAASLEVRDRAISSAIETFAEEKLEWEPVDTKMIARTKEVWPLVSVHYELEQLADELAQIYTFAYSGMHNWEKDDTKVRSALRNIEIDYQAVNNAMNLCKQPREN